MNSKLENTFSLTKNEIKCLAIKGGMAPSGGNAQPWQIDVNKNLILLKLNQKRTNNFLDIGAYASILALGCFLENITIEADSLGLKYTITNLPFKKINDPLVKITFLGRKKPVDHPLRNFLSKRVTNRNIHQGNNIDNQTIAALQKVTSTSSLKNKLYIHSSFNKKKDISQILGLADGIRMTNNNLLSQMMSEFRWNDLETEKTKDGIDMKTLELPANASKMMSLLNSFPILTKIIPRNAFEGMAKPLLIGCSHICCLAIPSKISPTTILTTGRLIERIWLNATKLGISFQPWTIFPFFMIRNDYFKGEGFNNEEQKILKKAAQDLKHAFGLKTKEMPIFIFRLSHAKEPTARSLRISWTEYTNIYAS